MSYEIPSQQPDLLLDYYERHFLRTLGSAVCPDYSPKYEDEDLERALKLYEPSPENMSITDSLVRPPSASTADQIGLVATRAKIWGDRASREVATREIFNTADSRDPNSEISDETIVTALVTAGRPDIAHIKLRAYRDRLGMRYRDLLYDVGVGYCHIAKSKQDLKVASGIIDELKVDDPKSTKVVTKRWGIFKTTYTHTDATKRRLHKELRSHVRGRQCYLEHPEHFGHHNFSTDEDPHPYATAYHEGGLSAAFRLHEYNNRGSDDPRAVWRYRTVVKDLAETGELALADQIAQEGLLKASQEYEEGAMPASVHYAITRYVAKGYARAHNLERAHEMVTSIPDYKSDTQTQAHRMLAEAYAQGYIDELEPGARLPEHCLGTAIDYIQRNVADRQEQEATLGWIMEALVPHGQTEDIKRLISHVAPLGSSPYMHDGHMLFAAHVVNKDYEACAEYLKYWPSERLTVDALASVVHEKQRRRLP
jgi:hypothetical protein